MPKEPRRAKRPDPISIFVLLFALRFTRLLQKYPAFLSRNTDEQPDGKAPPLPNTKELSEWEKETTSRVIEQIDEPCAYLRKREERPLVTCKAERVGRDCFDKDGKELYRYKLKVSDREGNSYRFFDVLLPWKKERRTRRYKNP